MKLGGLRQRTCASLDSLKKGPLSPTVSESSKELDQIIEGLEASSEANSRVSFHTLYWLSQQCTNTKDLVAGRQVRSLAKKNGFESNVFLGNCLIHMFSSLGSLVDVNLVFSSLPKLDVFTWSAVISAHAKLGEAHQAIHLYHCMIKSDVYPDGYVFVAVLNACSSAQCPSHGMAIHAHIVESGVGSPLILANTLIDMYAKCGQMDDARVLFNTSIERCIVTWSSMIAGYAHHGNGLGAFELFQQMQVQGLEANSVTFVNLLKAFSSTAALHQGKLIHLCIIERGLGSDIIVSNTLIDMYGKHKNITAACKVFCQMGSRSVASWNVMITGYTACGCGRKALQLLQEMRLEGRSPNDVTFINLLKACSSLTDLMQGKIVHAEIVDGGFESELYVGNTLIDMYTNCGSILDARIVFNKLPNRDSVTWNAMIAGYSQHWLGQESLELFFRMQQKGEVPSAVTFASILKACSTVAALDQGKLIHAYLTEVGFGTSIIIGNTLIDMYAKCGSLKDAHRVFCRLSKQDLVTWNAMLTGFSLHSKYEMALQCFHEMQREGLKPNEVTFVGLLSGCSHEGLVNEGCYQFRSMRESYGITPTLDHYNCMIDLLGRTGFLYEAESIFQSVSSQQNYEGLTALLSHCRAHCSSDFGRRCFDHLAAM